MRSTGKYVHQRIVTQEGKKAYQLCMQQCIDYVSSGMSVSLLRSKISGLMDESEHLYKPKLFNKYAAEIKAHRLAIDQALEIVSYIEGKFITGHCDQEPRTYRGKGILLTEDDSLFK